MDLAFEEKGFKNWKKLPEVFTSHKISEKKAKNRQILLQVLQNIQFSTGQGFVFWKDNDDRNSDQVLKRCQKLDPRVTEWSNKVQNKF